MAIRLSVPGRSCSIALALALFVPGCAHARSSSRRPARTITPGAPIARAAFDSQIVTGTGPTVTLRGLASLDVASDVASSYAPSSSPPRRPPAPAANALDPPASNDAVVATRATTARTLRDRFADTINVKDFGAVGDGVANDTPAIAAAVALAKSYPGGADVYLPAGTYAVTTIDLTSATPQWYRQVRLVGAGRFATRIIAFVAGRILVDMVGRNHSSIAHLQIDSSRHTSHAGLLLARSTTSFNCNNNTFEDVWVTGSYSKSAVISIACESTRWIASRFENTNVSAQHTTFYTSWRDDINISSAHGGTIAPGPNTDNSMIAVEFYAPFSDAHPLVFAGAASYRMFGCSLIAGKASGVHLATYRIDQDGPLARVFNGPIDWFGCHFEVYGQNNAAHWIDAGGGTSYLVGLHSYGGYYNEYNALAGAGAILDFDRTDPDERPVLQGLMWTPFEIAPGPGGVHFAYVYGVSASSIAFRANANDGVFIALGFIADSAVTAHSVAAHTVANGRIETFGAAPPTVGTWSVGAIRHNTHLGPGKPLGWACTNSGTLGRLNRGATRGSCARGSNVLLVNSSNELVPGQVIAVAGLAGFRIVAGISGTAVYLGSRCDISVHEAVVEFVSAKFIPLPTLGSH